MLAISSVYPSGLERTAASVPRLVLAPGTVEHDEWLAEALAEPVADQPRQQLGPAAGRERNDDLHRPGRIVLRAGGCEQPSQARLRRAAVPHRGGRVGKGARRASALANQTEQRRAHASAKSVCKAPSRGQRRALPCSCSEFDPAPLPTLRNGARRHVFNCGTTGRSGRQVSSAPASRDRERARCPRRSAPTSRTTLRSAGCRAGWRRAPSSASRSSSPGST